MHPDLALLIDLQRITSAIDAASKTLTAHPQRLAAIDAGVAEARAAVERAKATLDGEMAERRSAEKDLAVVAGRLEKYKDQLMAVKTNREYHAMQSEMASAQESVQKFEERILELMLQADEATAALKAAQARLVETEAQAIADRKAIEAEHASLAADMTGRQQERDAIAAQLPENTRRLFDGIRAKRGVAVVQMIDGHCAECNVRVRPMVLGTVKKNDDIVQCDTCSRIIYYVAPVAAPAAAAPPATT
jgi:predicted  nucleic acid-binding Zn-ribbon protein